MLFASLVAGCQSMTRQQTTTFAETPDFFDKTPALIANQPVFTLPKQTEALANNTQLQSFKKVAVETVPAIPKLDTALVQTTAHTATAPVMIEPKLPKTIKLAPTPKPLATDPESTRKIISSLLNSSNSIKAAAQDSLPPEPFLPPPLKFAQTDTMVRKAAASDTPVKQPEQSLKIPVAAPVVANKMPLPALEKLPQVKTELVVQNQVTDFQIPKAAICRSIKGRGNFVAMPMEKCQPGSTILVYWEMDGLTRKMPNQSASIAATVELVRSDRESIVASVRENLEKSGKTPLEGDFAAMQWTIPADLQPGDYRIRITATDQNKKISNQTDLDLTIVANTDSSNVR